MGRERGQTSAEYLGVIAVLVVVVALLAGQGSAIGSAIGAGIEDAICVMSGGGCDESDPSMEPPEPCVYATETRSFGVNGKILVVTVGEGGTLIREDRSDGSTRFTLIDDARVGAELSAGIEAQAGSVGVDASASLAAEGKLAGARVFEFAPGERQAADEFYENADGLAGAEGFFRELLEGDNSLANAWFGFENPVGDWIGDRLGLDDDDDFPEPDATFTSVEAAISGEAELSASAPGLVDAELSAALEAAGGARRINSGPDEGDVQVFVKLDAETGARLAVAALGAGVEANEEVVGILTLGEDLEPTQLELGIAARYTAGLDLSAELDGSRLASLSSGLESIALETSFGEGGQIELGARLDLTDPEVRDAALGLLDPQAGAAAVPELVEQLDRNATLTMQTSSLSTRETGAGLEVSLGVGGGGGFTNSEESTRTTSLWVKEPSYSTFIERSCEAP